MRKARVKSFCNSIHDHVPFKKFLKIPADINVSLMTSSNVGSITVHSRDGQQFVNFLLTSDRKVFLLRYSVNER